MKRVCQICGREFEAGTHHQLYCSRDCQKEKMRRRVNAWYLAHRSKHIRRTCKHCGREFEMTWKLRSFCSAECKAAHKAEDGKRVTKTCAWCGKEFETSSKLKRYCSESCQNKKNHGARVVEKTCVVCGKTFTTTNSRLVTCSDECRLAHKLHKDTQKRPREIRTCAWCGKPFSARVDLKTKCCSLSCAVRLIRNGSPEQLAARQKAKREAALARAAAKQAEREARRKKYGGFTDAQAMEVIRAQDGDPAKLYRLSQGWTDKQRKFAKDRYMERHGLKAGFFECGN